MIEKTIIFVRHGETLWNQEGRYQGQQDSPLSAAGLIQAEQAAQFLANRRIDAVYSSDLKRALVTAETIAQHHQVTPLVDERLREMSFGLWEGLTREEVREQHPDLWHSRGLDRLGTRIPQGELPEEVVERFSSFLTEHTSDTQEQTIVLVSHGGALRLILASLLSMPLEKSSCLQQSNTGISEMTYKAQRRDCPWEVVCINSTSHLR